MKYPSLIKMNCIDYWEHTIHFLVFCVVPNFLRYIKFKSNGVFNIENKMTLAPQSDEVRLINPRQVYYYLSEGIQPLRLECGYDEKIVFVYEKETTLRLFSKWRERDTGWKSNK